MFRNHLNRPFIYWRKERLSTSVLAIFGCDEFDNDKDPSRKLRLVSKRSRVVNATHSFVHFCHIL